MIDGNSQHMKGSDMEVSFHLIGEDQSIALSVDGQLVSGRKLRQLCSLLNGLASDLSDLAVVDDDGTPEAVLTRGLRRLAAARDFKLEAGATTELPELFATYGPADSRSPEWVEPEKSLPPNGALVEVMIASGSADARLGIFSDGMFDVHNVPYAIHEIHLWRNPFSAIAEKD